jgi:prophage DNA circulation protein
MSNFDLNNEADFLRATGSPAATALLTIAGLDPALWDIEESYYKADDSTGSGVKFHIFKSKANYGGSLSQIVDKGGNRKVKYTYPYLDGQTTDDIGKKAQTFELDVMLFGNGYKDATKSLIDEVNKPSPGKLLHPVRGLMSVVLEDYEITHTYESRNAARLRLVFTEHNFNVGSINDPQLSGFLKAFRGIKDAINACLAAFGAIDNAIATIQGAVALSQQLKNLLTAQTSTYKDDYAKVLVKINKSFNKDGDSDIPTVVPVNEGGARNADGTAARNTSVPFLSPNDPQVAIAGSTSVATAAAIESKQAQDEVNALRVQASVIIATMSGALGGQGEIDFADTILQIKKTALLMQDALKAGIQSSNATIIEYTVPRLMSLREVAFSNGLDVDIFEQIDILNPFLLSVNYIEQGTVLKIPVG